MGFLASGEEKKGTWEGVRCMAGKCEGKAMGMAQGNVRGAVARFTRGVRDSRVVTGA